MPHKGYKQTEEHRLKIIKNLKPGCNKGKRGLWVAWNKGKPAPWAVGNKWAVGHIPHHKDLTGYKQTREYKRNWLKKHRHLLGISKKYRSEFLHDPIKIKERKRMQRKRYKYLKTNAGELSIKTIQLIYEDNIKQYGTLTCYLCLQPIPFGKDHLEHKNPLSRGGTNEYNNLAIACQKCNCKKHTKTEEEYKTEALKL